MVKVTASLYPLLQHSVFSHTQSGRNKALKLDHSQRLLSLGMCVVCRSLSPCLPFGLPKPSEELNVSLDAISI